MYLLSVLLLLWKIFCSLRSQLVVRREKHRALKLAGLMQEKCQLLDKLFQLQKEHEALESAFKEACLEEEAREAQHWEAAYKQAARDRAKLRKQTPLLLRELKEVQSRRFQQQQWRMAQISRRIWALAEESKSLTAQVATAKAALCRVRKEGAQVQ